MISLWLKSHCRLGRAGLSLFRGYSQKGKSPFVLPPKTTGAAEPQQRDRSRQRENAMKSPSANQGKENGQLRSISGVHCSDEAMYIRRNIDLLRRYPREHMFKNTFKLLLENKTWASPYRDMLADLVKASIENAASFKTLHVIMEILIRAKKKELSLDKAFYEAMIAQALAVAANFEDFREHTKSLATLAALISEVKPEMMAELLAMSRDYLLSHSQTMLVDQQAVLLLCIAEHKTLTEDNVKIMEALVSNIAELSDVCDTSELGNLVQSLVILQSTPNEATCHLEQLIRMACKKIIERLQKRPLSAESFNPIDLCIIYACKPQLASLEEFSQLEATLGRLKIPQDCTLPLGKGSLFKFEPQIEALLNSTFPQEEKSKLKALMTRSSEDAFLRNYKNPLPIFKTIIFRKTVLGEDTFWSHSQVNDFKGLVENEASTLAGFETWNRVLKVFTSRFCREPADAYPLNVTHFACGSISLLRLPSP